MLGKLLKHEFKATARIFLPIFGGLFLLALINRLFFQLDSYDSDNMALISTSVFSMVLYIFVICAIFAMTLIVAVQRFYKNLLGDEGYLMFTLPARPWMHILTKLLVSTAWLMVSIFVTMLSIFLVVFTIQDFLQIPSDILDGLRYMFEEAGMRIFLYALEILVMMFAAIMMGILQIFMSIAIGHQLPKHRLIGSFGVYIGLNFVLQMLGTIAMALLSRVDMSSLYLNGEAAFHTMTLSTIGISLLLGSVFYLITDYLLSHRLNLE